MSYIRKYAPIIGEAKIKEIEEKAARLEGKKILNINSTYQGGGIAELLNSLIPLMNDVGIDAGWRILHASPDFFTITKKFYNALQGDDINLTQMKKKIYVETCKRFASYTHITHDCVVIHDIQPLPLINFFEKKQPWIWWCHSDASKPNPLIFNYFKTFVRKYDLGLFLSQKYLNQKWGIKEQILSPPIDPLSAKNKELSEKTIEKYLNKFNIPTDKPIICQVSRFDKWKDHSGVVDIFRQIRRKVDCRLVLVGCSSLDDPLGQKIYEDLLKKVQHEKEITLINQANDILVNSLQRKSAVIIQKSFKEGFGLTVSEALWKSTPVVASNVGGIPEQIINGKNGYLLNPCDNKGFEERIANLLKDKKLRQKMGVFGKEHVRRNFLVTTNLLKWIEIFSKILKK